MIYKFMTKLRQDKHFLELIKKSFFSFLIKIIGMLIAYMSMLYITNKFGAYWFGVLTLCITIVSIFSLIPKFGMDIALVRVIGELWTFKKFAEIKSLILKVFLFSCFLSLVFSLLLYIVSNFVSNYFLHKDISQYLKLMSVTIITNTILTIIYSFFQGIRKIKEFIIIQFLIPQLIFLIVLIMNNLIRLTNNLVLLYVISQLISLVIVFLIFINFLKKSKLNNNNIYNSTYTLKKILIVAFPMLLSGSFIIVMSWTDILMIGKFLSEKEVGIYSAAQKVAGLTSVFLSAINTVVTPKFVEFYSKRDFSGLEKIAKQSTKLIFVTSFPLLIIYFLFSKEIMSFFGKEFVKGYIVLLFLTIGQFVNAVSGSVGYIMQMTDNQKIFQNVIIIATLINVFLNILLIPKYGINGAAFATMCSMVFWNISLVLFIRKKLGFWTIFLPFL